MRSGVRELLPCRALRTLRKEANEDLLCARHFHVLSLHNKLAFSLFFSEGRKKWQQIAHSEKHEGACLIPEPEFLSIFIYFFFKFLFIYLFLAMLGLCCCARAFSSCGERGLLFVWCMGFSLWWLLLLQSMGSRCTGFSSCGSWALEQRLSSCGTWA